MISRKNAYWLSLMFIVSIIPSTPIYTFDDFDDEDDLFFNALDSDCSVNFNDFGEMTTRQAVPVVEILQELGVPEILQQDFYIRTSPLARRSLLDQPLLPIRQDLENDHTFGFQLFYNHMTKVNFTKHSTSISSYLDVCNPDLITKIDGLTQKILEIINVDYPSFEYKPLDIIPLIKDMHINQRQAGAMFHYIQNWRRLQFLIKVPLYYFERNENLDDANRLALEELFGESDTDFQNAHFVSDKFGLGDTRLEFAVKILERERYDMWFGPIFTIPTAVAFKKGLRGTNFEKQYCRPNIDIEKLFETVTSVEEFQAFAEPIALGAIDSFDSIVLENELGNNGHFGIGFIIESRIQISKTFDYWWAKRWVYHGYTYLEYLCPAEEKRSFKDVTDPALFVFDVGNDEQKAMAVLDFLQKQLINKFYTYTVNTQVQPGVIFRWCGNCTYEGDRFNFVIGSDTWVQGKETFDCVDNGYLIDLAIDAGKTARAYQWKAFTSLNYKVLRPERTWYIGMSFDGVLAESGIGRDYTATIDVIVNF